MDIYKNEWRLLIVRFSIFDERLRYEKGGNENNLLNESRGKEQEPPRPEWRDPAVFRPSQCFLFLIAFSLLIKSLRDNNKLAAIQPTRNPMLVRPCGAQSAGFGLFSVAIISCYIQTRMWNIVLVYYCLEWKWKSWSLDLETSLFGQTR